MLVAVALVVIVLAAVGAYIALSPQPPAPPPTDLSTFVIVNQSDPSSLDPAVYFDESYRFTLSTYESLTYITTDNKVQPVLATSWESNADGTEWTFHLRDGVKFHDGTDFNAEAVKYSLERVMAINKGGAYLLTFPVKEIQALDRLTVKFILNYPQPMDLVLSGGYAVKVVCPNYVKSHETGGDWGEAWMTDHACGTGPYKIDEWIRGQQVSLSRFTDYWGGWQGTHVDKVIFKIVREYSSMKIMLKEGSIDMMIGDIIPWEEIPLLKQESGIVVDVKPSFNIIYFRLNTLKPPLDNPKVRQALAYSFPYDDVANKIYLGNLKLPHGVIPEGMWGYDPTVPRYAYDLEKAKSLLAEAGYKDGGFTLSFMSTVDENLRRSVELWAERLSILGIKLEPRYVPWETLFATATNRETQPDIAYHLWWPSYPDPFDYLFGMFHSSQDGFFNWSHFNNTEYDTLIMDGNAMSSTDKQKASELYSKAERILVDAAESIIVGQLQIATGMKPWVHGFSQNPYYTSVVWLYNIYKAVESAQSQQPTAIAFSQNVPTEKLPAIATKIKVTA
jgi:peptide/nickel transport system substrate-binding protein